MAGRQERNWNAGESRNESQNRAFRTPAMFERHRGSLMSERRHETWNGNMGELSPDSRELFDDIEEVERYQTNNGLLSSRKSLKGAAPPPSAPGSAFSSASLLDFDTPRGEDVGYSSRYSAPRYATPDSIPRSTRPSRNQQQPVPPLPPQTNYPVFQRRSLMKSSQKHEMESTYLTRDNRDEDQDLDEVDDSIEVGTGAESAVRSRQRLSFSSDVSSTPHYRGRRIGDEKDISFVDYGELGESIGTPIDEIRQRLTSIRNTLATNGSIPPPLFQTSPSSVDDAMELNSPPVPRLRINSEFFQEHIQVSHEGNQEPDSVEHFVNLADNEEEEESDVDGMDESERLAWALMREEQAMLLERMQEEQMRFLQAMHPSSSSSESVGSFGESNQDADEEETTDGDEALAFRLLREEEEQVREAMERAEEIGESVEAVDPDQMTYDQLLELTERIGDVKQERWRIDGRQYISALETIKFSVQGNVDQVVDGSGEGTSSKTCLVCQYDFEDGEELKLLPCSHAFHSECIDPWLQDHDTCVTCKQSLRDLMKL